MDPEHNPLRASYYADGALAVRAPIVENVRLARATLRVRLQCPSIAARISPGQFVMLRLVGCDDPLVGRAFALYETYSSSPANTSDGIDLVYLVVGKLTSQLASIEPGGVVDVWGPLGNGFPAVETEHLILVAGGIGHTPFLAVANQWLGRKRYADNATAGRAQRITLCYGTRSRELISCIDDYAAAGVAVRITTDDGTAGLHGLVTDDLRDLLESTASGGERRHIFCCGPEPMMEATAELAEQFRVPCHVSLETPMACGIGICFSCVARVRQADESWDYKRTCVDGPIFDAAQIAW